MSKVVVVGVPGVVAKIEDIVQVAKGASVQLDQSTAARIKKESPSPSAYKAEERDEDGDEATSEEGEAISLTSEQTRATAFVLLLTLVNGKTKVRLQVVEKLTMLLNEHGMSLRATSSDGSVLSRVVELITAPRNGDDVTISSQEREVLTAGQVPTAALGALMVVASRQLQQAALAHTALTCEAIQADVKDFDAEKVESLCSAEAVEVASELRDLLNESVRVNARKGGAGALKYISMVPSVHGELKLTIQRAESMINSVVQSAPSDPALSSRLGPSICLPNTLVHLACLLTRAAVLSLERSKAVSRTVEDAEWILETTADVQQSIQDAIRRRQSAQEAVSTVTGEACFSGALAAAAGVSALLTALAFESTVLVLSLREQGIPIHNGLLVIGEPGEHTDVRRKKQKGKGGGDPERPPLGIGTVRFRAFLEEAVTNFRNIQRVSSLMLDTPGSAAPDANRTEAQIRLEALRLALDPLGSRLPREMAELQQLVQAHAKMRKPKVAKGARDFMPDQMSIRERAFGTIATVFERHGAVAIDTPVFELKETLTGKYGEDSKLIYDLKDQGGELLSLRYDLTVPFARYVALYGITSIKRYHLAKVYRRDQPQMARGRYREFYQCDFDVAGNSPLMVADAEVLKVLTEVLDQLQLGKFVVKINHRLLLDGIMSLCGVPKEKFRAICSAIDKLDKEPWDAVRAEMVDDKGLDPAVADKIGPFVERRGEPLALLAELQATDHGFGANENCNQALVELAALFSFLETMGALHHFSFDLSLARGLDYYTGVIYEAVLEGANVGSIAAGGRYDNLVGMFSGKQVPAVGVSLGVERIFSILEQKYRGAAAESNGRIRETKTQVLVMSASKDMQLERMRLASELWGRHISAEFTYKANPFMPEQMSHASSAGIPLGVVLRPEELKEDKVELMETVSGRKDMVPRSEVASIIEARLKLLGPLPLVVGGKPAAQ